jgi:3'-phosphoadenosine 5'-phosphosulfate (PAPS) 3'-phosphatase
MFLNQTQLEELLNIACEAAQKAGEMIAESSGGRIDVIDKESGSSLSSQVVTEIDYKSQQFILELIKTTLEKYDLALLSEELEDDKSRFEKEYFWAIDPLDGTLPFIENRDGFAVSISLISKTGTPVIGVVFDPTTSTLYHAMKGCGAFKNNVALKIPDQSEPWNYHFIVDQARMKDEMLPMMMEEIESELAGKNIPHTTQMSHAGAVMNVCWLFEKPESCYFKLPRKKESGGCIWDYGAVACIYSEAGGFVSDCFGVTLDLNSKVSVFMNRKGVFFASSEELQSLIVRLTEELR